MKQLKSKNIFLEPDNQLTQELNNQTNKRTTMSLKMIKNYWILIPVGTARGPNQNIVYRLLINHLNNKSTQVLAEGQTMPNGKGLVLPTKEQINKPVYEERHQ